MDLKKLVLWKDLHSEQQRNRDLKYFTQYDTKIFQELTDSLAAYINSLCNNINIPTKYSHITSNYEISKLQELTQVQRAILYHTATIKRLNVIIAQLYNNAIVKKKPITFSNATTILNHLPKKMIAEEFIANRVPRYGKFLAELQINNPDAYRTSALLIEQSRNELALNLFYALQSLLPQILSSTGIYHEFHLLLKNILKQSHQETAHISKYQNIFLFLKQAIKDSSVNFILDLIQAFKLDEYIAKKLAKFAISKTDDINLNYISLHALELTDVTTKLDIPISSDCYFKLISKIKTQRFEDLKFLVDQLLEKIIYNELPSTNLNKHYQEIEVIINKIEFLTPFTPSQRVPLKGQFLPNLEMMFIQRNIQPIIEDLKLDIRTKNLFSINTKPKYLSLLAKLKTYLSYSRQNAIREVDDILKQVERKILLAKHYKTNSALITAINSLSITISSNTKNSFFGNKKPNQVAQTAIKQRRELLYLLRDRINIALDQPPVPTVDKWDTFLINEMKGPLYTEAVWRNCFFAFTPYGSNQRFPGLLADQLYAIDYLQNLKNGIVSIIDKHKKTLPNIDGTEISDERIAGVSHLTILYKKLELKKNQLNSYVLYLEFKSILSTLEKIKWPNAKLCEIKEQLHLLINNIKTKTQKYNYDVPPPSQNQINKIINDLKSLCYNDTNKELSFIQSTPDKLVRPIKSVLQHKTDLNNDKSNPKVINKMRYAILIKQNDLKIILESLTRLSNFYYGDDRQRQAAMNTASRPQIDIHQLGLIRRILLAIINFHNYHAREGFIKFFNSLFLNTKQNCSDENPIQKTHSPAYKQQEPRSRLCCTAYKANRNCDSKKLMPIISECYRCNAPTPIHHSQGPS